MTSRLGTNKLFIVLALMLVGLVAWAAAMAAFGGGSGSSALPANFSVKGYVSYVIHDTEGNVVSQGDRRNDINESDAVLGTIFDFLVGEGAAFPRIAILKDTVGDIGAGDSIADSSRADGYDSNNQTHSIGTAFSAGEGMVEATFTRESGGDADLRRILLTSNTETTGAIDNDQILAWQEPPLAGDWDLGNEGDSVTFRWTIEIAEAP